MSSQPKSTCFTRLLMAAVLLSVSVLAFLVINRARGRAAETPPDPAVVAALQSAAVPLASTSPGGSQDDLAFLEPLLTGKRVVALGEATHGTREFFQLKLRLLQYLVEELDFRIFGMEVIARDAAALSSYVATGQGDPIQALSAVYPPWHTQEVLELVEWMRAYNADPAHTEALRFYGTDPYSATTKSDRMMAENVANILQAEGPDSKIVLWAHNYHIAKLDDDRMGYYLKQRFGDDAYLLGFEFDQGQFLSRGNLAQYRHEVFEVGPSGSGCYAHALAELEAPLVFLDFEALSQDPVLHTWLSEDLCSYIIDEMFYITRYRRSAYTQQVSWLNLYDGLVFVRTSTAARPLDMR